MTRKRLWSLTALACAVLLVPSIPWMGIPRIHPEMLALTRLDLWAMHLPALHPRLASPPGMAAAVALLLLLLAILAVRRRRTPARLAVVLARRGRAVAAISRQTRLSQDAVRDLLGGEPLAISTARRGKIFRRRPKPVADTGPSFADHLSETSFDAKA